MFISETNTFNLTFMGPSTWSNIFLINYNDVHHNNENIIFDSSSTVPFMFSDNQIKVYAGFSFRSRSVSRWMVGFNFGEFTWNSNVALYKANQLRKKNKKK